MHIHIHVSNFFYQECVLEEEEWFNKDPSEEIE